MQERAAAVRGAGAAARPAPLADIDAQWGIMSKQISRTTGSILRQKNETMVAAGRIERLFAAPA